ncbi:MinD/ParA family protein [Paenibacillus profundus]|uniref:MinD/ParA family protein n=1 Tax=Paenibacillus profundus TaxID=1173085 RepID=A0ABS8YA89_9BACL|nr:MinD/ParA family protein [Paenibacillus profundus]MCE5168074.1 MinD/ParA family protein [Paenibacillus profundus]
MMNDQAQALRRLVKSKRSDANDAPPHEHPKSGGARVVTVTSGKGGVGKSNFTLNFALSLQEAGYRTLVFDADIGMANIDVLLGSPASSNLVHVVQQRKTLQDIIQIGPLGMHYIPGGSGFQDLLELPSEQIDKLLTEMESWSERYDIILFDTGAGLSKETIRFILAADETFVVTTPEPTAIADAYALIKIVNGMGHGTDFRLVVNRAADWKEGSQTAERLSSVARRFLHQSIPTLGVLYDDPHVMQAVKKQTPFCLLYPQSKASLQIRELAKSYINGSDPAEPNGGVKQFIRNWLRRWSS